MSMEDINERNLSLQQELNSVKDTKLKPGSGPIPLQGRRNQALACLQLTYPILGYNSPHPSLVKTYLPHPGYNSPAPPRLVNSPRPWMFNKFPLETFVF